MTSVSVHPCTAVWFAQMLFTLSRYLNNKMRPVKAYLHFCSDNECEGYEYESSQHHSESTPTCMSGKGNGQPLKGKLSQEHLFSLQRSIACSSNSHPGMPLTRPEQF